MLDEYSLEIDTTDHQRVVLAIAALRLLVMGRTLDEARALAKAALAFRSQESDRGFVPASLSSGDDGGVAGSTTTQVDSRAA